jgi:hypothetical protein
LSLSGANFGYTFPAYSMTVLDLTGSTTQTSIALASGTLVVAAPNALANGASLSVGPDAATAFGGASAAVAAQAAKPEVQASGKKSDLFVSASGINPLPPAVLPTKQTVADIAWFLDAIEAQKKRWAGSDNSRTIGINQLLADGGL